jgi:hypothetical protein
MVYEGKGGHVKFSRVSSVGKGGMVICPFLDVNGNGRYDEGEQKVSGLNIKVSGGRIEKDYKDTTVRVYELEPFTTYYIELDRGGFESVSWQIPKPVISVTINPNQFKQVEVPIVVMGEVSGMVYLASGKEKSGIGRVTVLVCRRDSSVVARVMTEIDGYFTFLGLLPGDYFTMIDPAQLEKIGMIVSPATIPFRIIESLDGDLATGLEFNLRKVESMPSKNE